MNESEREAPTAPLLLRYFSRLRFPWLFALAAIVFGIDLVLPDVLPFVDELLFGLLTLLMGAWRKRKDERAAPLSIAAAPPPPLPPPEQNER
jgi:hypothetical protein